VAGLSSLIQPQSYTTWGGAGYHGDHVTMENGLLLGGGFFLIPPLLLPLGRDLVQLLLLFLNKSYNGKKNSTNASG